ncbi:Tetratricopeptide repeat protein 28 [Bienertia sinuspersici]
MASCPCVLLPLWLLPLLGVPGVGLLFVSVIFPLLLTSASAALLSFSHLPAATTDFAHCCCLAGYFSVSAI